MRQKIWSYFLIFTVFSGGMEQISTAPPCRVVQRIEVRIQDRQLVYLREDKLQRLLTFLRNLEPWDLPEQPQPAENAPLQEIILHYSDGSEKEYRIWALRYLSTERGPWQKIHQDRGLLLPLLLAAIPADE